MVEKVITYRANDGTVFAVEKDAVKHENFLAGRRHECPKCKGTGAMQGRPIHRTERDREGEAFLGWGCQPQYKQVFVGYERDTCSVCSGHGYTAKPVEVITEQVVVGYK